MQKWALPLQEIKKANDFATAGWQVYTQSNGAWALHLNDGQGQYSYRPTPQRQRINDGNWHQIVFTVDRAKDEVWMYLDGRNVAIYNTPDLGGLETELATIIGGSDEKWEYGSYAQWNAFNGFVDEVKIWNRVISSQEVHALYAPYFSKKKVPDSVIKPQHIKVLSWNIWHGGHRYGEVVGVERVIETIKSTNADIIGLVD